MSDKKNILRSIMHGLKELMPVDSSGEQTTAIRAYHKVLSIKDLFQGNLLNRLWDRDRWPVTSGDYLVGDGQLRR